MAVLERHWQAFRRRPQLRVCRWVFTPDEQWLLSLFLQEQAGINAVSNDIFVVLRTPLQSWQRYVDQALDELTDGVQHDLVLLDQHGLSVDLADATRPTGQDAVSRFVQYLHQLNRTVRTHTDGALVLCLLPESADDKATLEPVLTALLQRDLPADLRLLVTDTVGAEQLATLCGRFRADCYSSTIDMQLPKIIRQLAALGSPTAPDVKFRQWQAELTAALAQRNLRDVQYFANNCLLICGQQNWPVLAGSVHLSVAYAYVDHRRFEEALTRYGQVIEQMERLCETGDASAGQLSIMAWLGGGGVYETLRQRPRAIDYYQRAGDRAEALQDWLLAIESYRRLSIVHEQSGSTKASEAAYQHLFALAEKLPPEQHGAARLTEIGKRYWNQQTTSAGRHKADERLSQLLGTRWRRSNTTL